MQLNLTKIAPRALKGTIWASAEPVIDDLDVDVLERLFSKRDVKKRAKAPQAPKKKLVELLDAKRGQGIAIAQSRLASAKLIVQSLKQGKPELLLDNKSGQAPGAEAVQEVLHTLERAMPTAEERKIVEAWCGGAGHKVAQLGPAETFIVALGEVHGDLGARVQALLVEISLRDNVSALHAVLDAKMEACKGVVHSKHFKYIMATVLSLGNFLNNGTRRGGLQGFVIESILKIGDTKSPHEEGFTLMHYLIEHCSTLRPSVLDLLIELDTCKAAAAYPYPQLSSDFVAAAKDLSKLAEFTRATATSAVTCKDSKQMNERLLAFCNEVRSDSTDRFEFQRPHS